MTTNIAQDLERLPPVHPGEVLSEEFLVPMKITQYALAKAIGVDPRRIHAIVHGERSITAETALLLSRFFGNSAQFWMGPAESVRPRNRRGPSLPDAGMATPSGSDE